MAITNILYILYRYGGGCFISSFRCCKMRLDLFYMHKKFYTFQDIILQLQHYWAEQGCVILQPLDMEVGAGTFHSATFLRALGPEPWSAAYVQPSRRPTDGRYGKNPNRMQHYYQFQVILKPHPHNVQ